MTRGLHRGTRVALLGVVVLIAASCSERAVRQQIAPPDVENYVRRFLDTLLIAPPERSVAAFSERLARVDGVLDSLRSVQRHFADVGAIDSAVLVGGNVNVFAGGGSRLARRDLAYEVYGTKAMALVQILLVDENGLRSVDGLHLEPLTSSLARANGFWENLRLAQSLVLCLTLGVAAFSLGTAVVVARTRMPKRWWWALVAVIGAGKFWMNWTTGEMGVQLLSLQLFGASVLRAGLVGPWVVAFSFPIGAVLALRQRRSALASAPPPLTPTVAPSDTPSVA
jgi:hypothetical protein